MSSKFTPPKEVENLELTPLGLSAWSFSKVKTLKNCPLKFYLQYVIKIKPLEKPPISLVTEVGKAAHRVLEFMVKGKSIDDSFKATRKEYQDVLSDIEWNDHVASLELSMMSFKERLDKFEKDNGIKRFVQELRVAVDKDWQPTGFFSEDCYYRGVIDLAIQMNNGDALFIDHKTGAPAIMGIRNFQDQLDTYKVLFHTGIENIKGAQAGIHFIRDGEIALDDYVSKDIIENSLINRVEFSIEAAIDTVKEIGYFKHKRAAGCKWCDYNEECKAGNFKDLEMDSKKYFSIKPI